jgi:hypothetical protein
MKLPIPMQQFLSRQASALGSTPLNEKDVLFQKICATARSVDSDPAHHGVLAEQLLLLGKRFLINRSEDSIRETVIGELNKIAPIVAVRQSTSVQHSGSLVRKIASGVGFEVNVSKNDQPISEVEQRDTGQRRKRSAVLVRADAIKPVPIKWSWRGRFAFGKLALIAGDPGLGKSQIALDIVARHTTSEEWPVDVGRAELCDCVVLTAEDGLADTVVPRLLAAGADLSKVHFLTGTRSKTGEEECFDLTKDVEVLRDMLEHHPNVKIISIDPLTAYLGDTQAQRNSQVRKALAPLVKLIEETGVLVIGVTHLNKSQGKAIYRVLDSIAFVALGRIVHLVIADVENPDNRKFLCDKTNIGPKPLGLTFLCQEVEVKTDDGTVWVSRISWGTRHIHETADEALAADTGPKATAKDDAIEFLRKVLAAGRVKVVDLEPMARAAGLLGQEEQISQCKPLRSAREFLGIEPYPEGFGHECKWFWELPKAQ